MLLYAIESVFLYCTLFFFKFNPLLYYYTWPTSHYCYCLSFAIILVCHQTEKDMGRCELALARCNIPVAQDAATCSHSIIANQDSLCNGHIISKSHACWDSSPELMTDIKHHLK